MELKSSVYWLEEKLKTEEYLSELIHGSKADLKSVKSDEDSTSYHDIQNQIDKVRFYLKYCETQYQLALDRENPIEAKPKTHILYFNREFGY